jgi:hypothetical protein
MNRRFGTRFHLGSNYTWSKTLTYTRYQFTPDYLNKMVAPSSRPHTVNINASYKIPNGSSLWKNKLTEFVADNWNFDALLTFYSGQPLAITCQAVGAPIGYWTGTPTGGLPFRCQQTGSLWLPSNATPASVGSSAPANLWYNFNPASFALPPVNSLGIGNAPPQSTYGPGVANADLSLYKQFKFGETRMLEFRIQAFNALNHFNPANPNTTLQINFASGLNTNAAFGSIPATSNGASATTSQQVGGAVIAARRAVLSVRFTF